MDRLTLWGVFLAVWLGTFLIRLSFVQLHGSMQSVLERCQSVLILLPPALLLPAPVPSCSKRYHYNNRFIVAVICGVSAGLLLASLFKRPMFKRPMFKRPMLNRLRR